MQFRILIIFPVLILQVAAAQNGPASLPQGNATAVSVASSTVMPTDPASSPASTQVAIVDYKSVYDAPTKEEEVKMAAERFNLTPSQQDVWLTAATDRREVEKQAREKIDSKAPNYEKEGAYKGLKSAQNTFYETIIGYLSPAQKQAFETDRLILQEKQKRLAKLAPPPPPAPSVTVAPVDSTAIKQAEKSKVTGKKSKTKKRPVVQ
jgi:hypothetical protein